MIFFHKNILLSLALAFLSLSTVKAEVSFSTLNNVEKISEENFYEYIRLIVVQQPEFSSAVAKSEEYKQNKKYAQRLRFPTIEASIINDESISRKVDDASSLRKRRDDSFDGVISIKQPLYKGNQINSKIKKAKFGEQIVKEELNLNSSLLVIDASEIYINTATSFNLSEYATSQLDKLRKYRDIAQKRFESGAINISESSAIKIKLSELSAKEAILNAKKIQNLEVFSFFFKEPYNNQGLPVVPLNEVLNNKEFNPILGSYEQRIASLQKKGSESDLAITKSSYRPEMGLALRLTKYDIDSSGKDEDVRGGLYFSVPLFNFGRGSAEIGAASARVSQSKFMYDQTSRDIEKERAYVFGSALGIIQARSKISDSLENIRIQKEMLNLRISVSDYVILELINATIQELNLLEQLLDSETQLLLYEFQANHLNRRLLSQFSIIF
jgi:outer membrane protein TolC